MADTDKTDPAAGAAAAPQPGQTPDDMADLKARSDKYGAGFAVASEAFRTPGAERMVLGAKVVIGVIVAYALFSALRVGLFGG